MATPQYTVFNSATAVGKGDPVQEGAITIAGNAQQFAVPAVQFGMPEHNAMLI